MIRFPILSSLAAVALSACTVMTPAGQAPLGPDPTLGGGSYTSPGGITVAVDVREIQGRTGVCGVWAESVNQSVMTRGAGRQVLGSGAVVLGGEAITQGLGFLRLVPAAESYAGMQGNCVATDRPWQAGDAAKPVKIVLPRQVVFNDMDGGFGESGGILIWFRPSGPGAHPSDRQPWYQGFPKSSKAAAAEE